MSEVTNQELATVFRRAKRHLRSAKHTKLTPFICVAILCCRATPRPVRLAALELIMQRLGGEDTVTSWLDKRGYFNTCHYTTMLEVQAQVQMYRHRWLNALVEEFSA